MSEEIPESKASSSLNKDELIASCSLCHVEFKVRYRDRDGAVHDQATGDLVCRRCVGKGGNTSTYPYCSDARSILAAPFFLKREARLSSDRSPQGMANLDRCPAHSGMAYAAVDKNSLSMRCSRCEYEAYRPCYISFDEAHSMYSECIVAALTTPFFSKNTAHTSTNNVSLDDTKDNVLLAMTHEMNPVVNQLTSFVSELRGVKTLVYNQLSQLVPSEHPIASLGIEWEELAKDVTAFMDSIGDAFDMGAQSVVRALQRINGSILEAMAIVGLENIDVEEMGKKVLSSRPVTPTTVAEIVLVVRTLESLKGTLQQGDIGGLSQLNMKNLDKFLSLSEVLSRSSLDPIRLACTSLSEMMLANGLNKKLLLSHLTRLFKTIISLDNKYFEIFTYPAPRTGLEKLLTWEINLTSKLDKELLFQKALNILIDDDMTTTGIVTHHIMNIIKHIESTGDPNVFLLKALLRYNGVEGSNFMFFKYAQDKGCTHPLLYYFLGNCYLADPNQSNRDRQKALECFHMTIEGGYPIGYVGISRWYEAEREEKGLIYLKGLVNEGYTHGDILYAIGMYYKRRSCGGLMALQYFEEAAAKGYSPVYGQIRIIYRFGNIYELRDQRYQVGSTLARFLHQGVRDDHIYDALLTELFGGWYTPTGHDLVLAGLKDETAMTHHYCDLLIQQHNPHVYRIMSAIYCHGRPRIPANRTKSLRILEEAAELGLLSYIYYKHNLLSLGNSPASVNNQAIAYLKKCLEIAPTASMRAEIYEALANRHDHNDKETYQQRAREEKANGDDCDFLYLFGERGD